MSVSAPDTEENGKIDVQLSINKKNLLFEHETSTYYRQKLAMEIARALYEKPTYRSRKNITEILRSLKEKRVKGYSLFLSKRALYSNTMVFL